MVKVSIIIPMYNAAKYIEQSITSLVNQTFKDIEIICIDDGSSDKTVEICERLACRDKRIIILKQDNHGVSSARNLGIMNSRGEYIAFCDSDDYYVDDAVATMYYDIRNDNLDAIFYNYYYDYDGKLLKRKPRLNGGRYSFKDLNSIILDDGTLTSILFPSVCGAVYRAEIIKRNNIGFDENVKINEDGFFNIDYLSKSRQIQYRPELFLYCYRQYKNTKLIDYKELILKIDVANKHIESFVCLNDMEKQILCRKLTMAFQVSLIICESLSFGQCRKELLKIWENFSFIYYIKYINHKNINFYKRVLSLLICLKQAILFAVIIKYLYPLLKNRVKR